MACTNGCRLLSNLHTMCHNPWHTSCYITRPWWLMGLPPRARSTLHSDSKVSHSCASYLSPSCHLPISTPINIIYCIVDSIVRTAIFRIMSERLQTPDVSASIQDQLLFDSRCDQLHRYVLVHTTIYNLRLYSISSFCSLDMYLHMGVSLYVFSSITFYP